MLSNRGEILSDLRRYAEAADSLESAVRILDLGGGPSNRTAHPLTALGVVKLATNDLVSAVSVLERALRIREEKESNATLVADTRFALARALWQSGGDRGRALALATSARAAYASDKRARQLGTVDVWLAAHAIRRP